MAENETKHEPGTMDISVQEETFTGFVKFSTVVAVICIVVVIFLALVGA
ncbi:aa3-type cytochrome c oxidase subunit IV [Actibacterium mucosum]|nr:aa3-type cytochrome c oxidase subunit IV [Actibacterium mucosum]